MIPAFCPAISSSVEPSHVSWSIDTGVTTATSGCTTFVVSHVPPRPVSTTATSTGVSAKAANAMSVSTSKKLSRGSPRSAARSSTIVTTGSTSSQARTKAACVMGSPSIEMRSVMSTRCGLVNRPVRRSCSRTSRSTMRAVDVFPLVPARCTTR